MFSIFSILLWERTDAIINITLTKSIQTSQGIQIFDLLYLIVIKD